MATTFLTRDGCNSAITDIVREAKDEIWLISPFVKINDQLVERLQSKDRTGIDMRLVHGKRDLREDEREPLESLKSLRIYYRAPLHAKCYMNEDWVLITSLNLIEYSQIKNDEWGILVSRQADEALYRSIRGEAEYIFGHAVLEKEAARDLPPPPACPSRADESHASADRRLHKRRRRYRFRNTQAILRQVLQKLEQVQEPRIRRKAVPRLRQGLGD